MTKPAHDATDDTRLALWDWIRQRDPQWLPETGHVFVFAFTPEQRETLMAALSPFTNAAPQDTARDATSREEAAAGRNRIGTPAVAAPATLPSAIPAQSGGVSWAQAQRDVAEEKVKTYEAMFPLLWLINDNLSVTPDQAVAYSGSTNDVDNLRAMLHRIDPRFRLGIK